MPASASRAVFLSYASQDAEAAQHICDSLRAAGAEVWFDRNELVGGDAWDGKIRRQIATCALFVPVISANTQSRLEGYFRIEWKLAAQRTHAMAEEKAFLLPVVIDATQDSDALVPSEFKSVQWTRLAPGETSAAFCTRVKALLDGPSLEPGRSRPRERGEGNASPAKAIKRRSPVLVWLAAAVAMVALAATLFFALRSPLREPHPKNIAGTMPPATPSTAAPASEARRLTLQARALIDDDWLAVRENFRLAAELCERATTLNPDDGETWATWARVSLETIYRNYDTSPQIRNAARQQLERAIRLAPDSIEAGLAVATNQTRNGQLEDARQRLRELIERAPLDRRVALALSFNLRASSATQTEGMAMRMNHPAFGGGDPQALAMAAAGLYGARKWGECEAAFARAATLAPCYDRYARELAYLILASGDLAAAKKLLATTPAVLMQEDVFVGLEATLWLRLGDGARAFAALRRTPRDYFSEIWFDTPKGYFAGWALRVSGKSVGAEAEWKQALAVVERRLEGQLNDATLLARKAVLLALTGRPVESEQTWQLASDLSTKSIESIILDHAELLVALGRTEDAVRELNSRFKPIRNTSEAVSGLNRVRFEPWAEPLRGDPRVQAILAEQEKKIAEWRERPE